MSDILSFCPILSQTTSPLVLGQTLLAITADPEDLEVSDVLAIATAIEQLTTAAIDDPMVWQ